MRDHYKILEVPRDASNRDIKRAYRKLAFWYHPDRDRDYSHRGVKPIFKHVVEAYQVLSDPTKRKLYDYSLDKEVHLIRSEEMTENDRRPYFDPATRKIKKIEGFKYDSLDHILRETETWDIRLKFNSYLGLSAITTVAGLILASRNGLDSAPFEWIVKADALEHYKELVRNNSPMAKVLEVVLGGAIGMGTGFVAHLGVLAVDGIKRVVQYQREEKIENVLDSLKDQ